MRYSIILMMIFCIQTIIGMEGICPLRISDRILQQGSLIDQVNLLQRTLQDINERAENELSESDLKKYRDYIFENSLNNGYIESIRNHIRDYGMTSTTTQMIRDLDSMINSLKNFVDQNKKK